MRILTSSEFVHTVSSVRVDHGNIHLFLKIGTSAWQRVLMESVVSDVLEMFTAVVGPSGKGQLVTIPGATTFHLMSGSTNVFVPLNTHCIYPPVYIDYHYL